MGNDIKIKYGQVTLQKALLSGLVAGQIVTVGKALSEKAIQAWESSHCSSLLAMKWYMKQEQELMETLGSGLEGLMDYLNDSAKDFEALDQNYATSSLID